jgi:hypothetical protein
MRIAYRENYTLASIPPVCYNPHMVERNSELQEESRRGGMVELRFRIPFFVADWLTKKADENFKHRNTYIRDILIQLYRRDNGRS